MAESNASANSRRRKLLRQSLWAGLSAGLAGVVLAGLFLSLTPDSPRSLPDLQIGIAPIACLLAIWISSTVRLRSKLVARTSLAASLLYLPLAIWVTYSGSNDLALFISIASMVIYTFNSISNRPKTAFGMNVFVFSCCSLFLYKFDNIELSKVRLADLRQYSFLMLINMGVFTSQHIGAVLRWQAFAQLRGLEDKIAELELRRRRTEEHSRAKEEVARLSRASVVESMLGSISHEIAQPTSAALNFTNAAIRWLKRDPPNLDSALHAAMEAASELNRIGPKIAYMRSLVARSPTDHQIIDLGQLIQSVISLVLPERQHHIATVGFETPPEPVRVNGSVDELSQAISNVLANSLDSFLPTQTDSHIEIAIASSADGWIEVSIADNGPRRAASNSDEPLEGLRINGKPGAGLGLLIGRAVAEAHGGTLGFASGEGWNKVTFLLPPPFPNDAAYLHDRGHIDA